jgi:hypothetical protein
MIPIDFVAGSHGNFLETVLNKYFGMVAVDDTFTATGTSHRKTSQYNQNKLFSAKHWFELHPTEYLQQFDKIISIGFTQDDLLLLSSVSLLRAGDFNISNDELEIDTRIKLDNLHYRYLLDQIDAAYSFLDRQDPCIPRNVLREFFKFGFRDPSINGYWQKQKQMVYPKGTDVLYVNFDSFYNIDKFVHEIKQVENFVGMKFDFCDEFYNHHQKFLSFIPYVDHKQTCDHIIDCVKQGIHNNIPKLSLFQESYINGCLENIYGKEMPFQQDRYFTSTKDMLYYINNLAPNL